MGQSVTQGVKVNNSTYESVKENKASWFDNVGKAVSFCGCNDLASATDNSCSWKWYILLGDMFYQITV